MPSRGRAHPLANYVVALSTAILVPTFLLIAILAWKWVEAEQRHIEDNVQGVAISASGQIDRYIAGQIAMLQALATSPAIDHGDFAYLDSQMRELARIHGTNIVMRGRDGDRPVDTRYPTGHVLPKMPLTSGEVALLKSSAAFVSDLFVTAAGSRTQVVRVSVPVIRNDEVRYVIAARLPAAKLSDILRESGVRFPYSGAVIDRTGRIVATSEGRPEPIATEWPSRGKSRTATTWTAIGKGGAELLVSDWRSTLSDWRVGVTVPTSYVNAPLYRSLYLTGLFGLALAVLVAILSKLIARRIIRAQQQVRAAAIAIGLGETVSAPRTQIRETDLVGDALAEASIRLRDQAAALVAANQDLEARVGSRTRQLSEQSELIRATLDNMAQGLVMVDTDGRIAICNERAIELLDLPADLVSANPTYSTIIRLQSDRGDFATSDETVAKWTADSAGLPPIANYEREQPDGKVLEIRTVRLAGGGAVRTYTDITARKNAERQAVHLARHDPLTSLPNRTLFLERLEEDLADPGRSFALLLIDLDHFKSVNDRYGHPTGDALLCRVTERLRALISLDDFLVRLGGDEFAIVRSGGGKPADALTLAERIVKAIAEPFSANGHDVRIGTSIGISVVPSDGNAVDQILKCADVALYRAKSEGRNVYRAYEPTMDTAARELEALEMDLRLAVENGELELHYQPIVGLVDREIVGFEALCRWNHAVRGLVPPDMFIAVAEETRLIVKMGRWILHEACRAAMAWPSQTKVLINISAIQIEEADFVESVIAAIEAANIAPERVQLEITESVLVRENEAALLALTTLREFGLKVALDDFGTKYSSLTYLRLFPLDTIKIDRSFVRCFEDPRSARIMSAIASLAADFGMSVTAEGVETHEQLDFVASIGCTDAQGYLFGKAMRASDTQRWLGRSPVAQVA